MDSAFGRDKGALKIALRVLNEFINITITGNKAIKVYVIRTACAAIARPVLFEIKDCFFIIMPLKLITAKPRLNTEKVEANPDQNDQEHNGGNGRTHVRITQLQLETEEGSEHKRAQYIC